MEQNLTAGDRALRDTTSFRNDIKFPLLIRGFAYLFSFMFHPLFIPVIATWFLAYIQPGYFTGMDPKEKMLTIIRVALNTIFFPLVTVLLLKALGFIKSIFLESQRERIIPYIATNIFYFWMFLVLNHQPEIPTILTGYIFGIFIASSAGLIANIYFKVSMHALGIGSLCGLMLIIIFSGFTYPVFLIVMLTLIITGVVSTSRMIAGTHTPFEIYAGILIAILCQVISYSIFG